MMILSWLCFLPSIGLVCVNFLCCRDGTALQRELVARYVWHARRFGQYSIFWLFNKTLLSSMGIWESCLFFSLTFLCQVGANSARLICLIICTDSVSLGWVFKWRIILMADPPLLVVGWLAVAGVLATTRTAKALYIFENA